MTSRSGPRGIGAWLLSDYLHGWYMVEPSHVGPQSHIPAMWYNAMIRYSSERTALLPSTLV